MGNLLAINGQIINSQEPLPIPVDILTLLWENPNPGATFAPQDITLASDDYDFLLLVVQFSPTYDRMISCIVEKGDSGFINAGSTGPGGAIGMWREFVRTNDTTYSVSGAHTATGASGEAITNNNLIPNKIYGFKKQVPMQDGGASRGSVIINADGVKTYAQLMTDLYNMLDHSLINERTVFVMNGTDNVKSYGHLGYNSYDYTVKKYIFVAINGSANGLGATVFSVAADSANSGRFNTNIAASGNTVTNSSNAVPGVGYSFKIIY